MKRQRDTLTMKTKKLMILTSKRIMLNTTKPLLKQLAETRQKDTNKDLVSDKTMKYLPNKLSLVKDYLLLTKKKFPKKNHSNLKGNRMSSTTHMISQQVSIMDSISLQHIHKIHKVKLRSRRRTQVLSRKRSQNSSEMKHLRKKVKFRIKDLILTLEGITNNTKPNQ